MLWQYFTALAQQNHLILIVYYLLNFLARQAFPSDIIEKKWIAFQLLSALDQSHSVKVCELTHLKVMHKLHTTLNVVVHVESLLISLNHQGAEEVP